jgi:hypothetical protein
VDGDVIQALIPTTIAAVILWRALLPVRDAEIQRFVDRFFVRVEPEDVPFVRARLRRSRAVRMGAIAVGVLVAGLPVYMNLIEPTRSGDFANPVVGNAWIAAAACAALFAEVMVVQWPIVVRRAAIEVRRPHDYVASRWTRLLAATAVLTLVLSGIGLAATSSDRFELVASAAGAVIAVAATWVGLRQITDRPRLSLDGPLRQIDDGLRCYGAHHLVGAAIGLAMISLSTVIVAIAGASWLSLLGLVVAYLGLWLWWGVARDERLPVRKTAVAG